MKLRPWQVAARLQVDRKTVQRYHDRGWLPGVRDARGHRWFDSADVDAFLRRLLDGEERRTVGPLPAEPRCGQRPVRRGFDLIDDDEL